MTNEALIVAAVRTPIGSLGGVLSGVPATELGATCIKAVLDRARIPGDEVDEVIMGNVVSAGIGQNPARQASIKAGLPVSVGAMTINKVCGSGLKAVMLAAQAPWRASNTSSGARSRLGRGWATLSLPELISRRCTVRVRGPRQPAQVALQAR